VAHRLDIADRALTGLQPGPTWHRIAHRRQERRTSPIPGTGALAAPAEVFDDLGVITEVSDTHMIVANHDGVRTMLHSVSKQRRNLLQRSMIGGRVGHQRLKHDYNHHRRHSAWLPTPARYGACTTNEQLSFAVDLFTGPGQGNFRANMCVPVVDEQHGTCIRRTGAEGFR